MKRFHNAAERVMVSSELLANELSERGFSHLWLWPPGIDVDVFRPYTETFLDYPRPILFYVGRVAVEKNIEAFLRLDTQGTKVVVGDCPQLTALRAKHPEAGFAGVRSGEELARYYSAADVMVFPSRTDTFGLVTLEALACGTPVAAFNELGTRAAVGASGAACLDEDLHAAIQGALKIPRERCRTHAMRFSWANSARSLLAGLAPCSAAAAVRAGCGRDPVQ
jgi:glycosyltransferase involved in cell wall biosynthesis